MRRKGKLSVVIPFLAPAVILYIYFFIVPAIRAFYISLTEWNGFNSKKVFIGLENFRILLNDGNFGIAVGNTFIYMIVGGLLTFGVALLFTFILTQRGMKGRKFFPHLYYFPNMVSQAALAVLWAFVFSPNFGLLNNILKSLGLESLIQVWLGSRPTAVASIIVASSWGFMGFYLLLLLAGVDKIPPTYYEAAGIDGASNFRVFRSVTLPLLRDVVIISISLWIINIIKYFEMIWALTKGGPSNATHTLATYMYITSFGIPNVPSFNLGLGTAVGVMMFIIMVVVVGLFRKIFEKEPLEF